VRLTDFMPPRDNVPDLVRVVEGVRGRVEVTLTIVVRFGYGKITPWVRSEADAVHFIAGPDALALETSVPPARFADLRLGPTCHAKFVLEPGDKIFFRLAWYRSHTPPPDRLDWEQSLANATGRWRAWSERQEYRGRFAEVISRSLITLKALTFDPTGGIVAAPTTSLPEEIGGERNWDYRYCWLRDSAFTLGALADEGYTEEAHKFWNWMLRAVAGDPSQVQIMYGVAGERDLPERELPWLSGYENSSPVRIGNGASGQLQLDVYGELMHAAYQERLAGHVPDESVLRLRHTLLDHLQRIWRQPDEGIWEVRGPRRHFTHSKLMAWVAFDRAVRLCEEFGEPGPVRRYREVRDQIHAEICERAFNPEFNAFTQYYGGRSLDASVLNIVIFGFLPADDERVVSTVEAIEDGLVDGGFVYRYATDEARDVDGLRGREGAFLACTLWLVDALVLIGRVDDALEYFERVVSVANDVGLLAEEYHPEHRRQLGNFPQAFTHVYLIQSAQVLRAALEGESMPQSVSILPGPISVIPNG
jgi:GH15 family glucan-1,4-alpha-glucosidase